MKKMIIGALIALAIVFVVRSCSQERARDSELLESSLLIRQQIENVAKLVVTEGHFSEVYSYKDSRQLFGPLISARKKALVVVNADVSVAYDLKKLEFEVDDESRTLRITSIPEPELNISPDFEYYDVQADYLNPFDADDYNSIKEEVNASLERKIRASTLMSNARNRLLSELSKFILLTNTLEWTLVFEGEQVTEESGIILPD